MKEETRNHIENIKNEFARSFLSIEEFRGDVTLFVRKDDIFAILKYLKESNETAFDFLVDITCVDYLKLEGDERFGVIYNLHSYTYHTRMLVKAWVPEEDLNLPTMMPLWKTANWLEREIFDLFGINFEGHPDLQKILMPETFQGYPLRKDYPLRGEGFREDFPDLKNK